MFGYTEFGNHDHGCVTKQTGVSYFIYLFVVSLTNIIYKMRTFRYTVGYFFINFAKGLIENYSC